MCFHQYSPPCPLLPSTHATLLFWFSCNIVASTSITDHKTSLFKINNICWLGLQIISTHKSTAIDMLYNKSYHKQPVKMITSHHMRHCQAFYVFKAQVTVTGPCSTGHAQTRGCLHLLAYLLPTSHIPASALGL